MLEEQLVIIFQVDCDVPKISLVLAVGGGALGKECGRLTPRVAAYRHRETLSESDANVGSTDSDMIVCRDE